MKQTQENNNQMENKFTFATSESSTDMGTFTFSPSFIQEPFSVIFSWKEERVMVKLENGEDVLKLAQIFSDFLTTNDIPNKIIKE